MATRKAAAAAPETDGALLVTQVRSAIGTKPKHRGTLRALGLRKLGQSNVVPDRQEIRGMLARVPHLVSVEPAPASARADLASGRVRRSDSHGVSEEGSS
ncbi:MAG TPA: 50S ribosomal protein L30 [Acidimicrobiales bacterium]|nr:50S ribosomal protein L30 [Acidimicrobiales bacterium]